MRIGVDLISGESAIEELIKGCIDAIEVNPDIDVVMIGKGDVYRPLLQNKKISGNSKNISRISIIEASEIVTMEDEPLSVIKHKKDSSIVKGLRAHKAGEIDAFFSPGNTGALVVGSALILGRVKGIKKPALTSIFPTVEGGANIILDVGASTECELEDLVKFAVMGSIYTQEVLEINNPRVALLNIGTEEHKGTALVKDAYKSLSELNLNFIGNIEGRDLFVKHADVIVCDGNIGNIALKTAEGTIKAMASILKQSIKSSILAQLSYIFYKGAINAMKSKMDPDRYNGVPLLGINGNVFKGHGNAGRFAIKYGILNAAHAVKSDILGKINRKMEELHLSES